jgi:hypothetical protein
LSYLADRWLLTLDGRSQPISALIVEASTQRLLVRNVDFGYEGDIGMTFLLDVPVDGRLRRSICRRKSSGADEVPSSAAGCHAP